jgi:hypothetical protein
MEKFLEAAAIAWNPIGEVRRRIGAGTLTVGSVLVPFISIVIICNLFGLEAQKFFLDSVSHATGGELPNNPLMKSGFAQRFISAIGVLVPAAAVSLLPQRVFDPPGRSSTVATMLVVAAAWAFYGAATTVPFHFIAGVLTMVSLDLGLNIYNLLSIPIVLGIVGLSLFFWFRITMSVLSLRVSQVAIISFVALAAGTLLIGFFLFIVSGM